MSSFHPSIVPFAPGEVWGDESRLEGTADYYVRPKTEEELRQIVLEAGRLHLRITLSGGRTGVVGGAVPSGGLLMDLSAFQGIQVEGDTIWAEAGARLADVRAACPEGLFFPPDPTETSATIGGMLAYNASGAECYAYGATRASIAAIRIMLLDGSIHELRRGFPKVVNRKFTLGAYSGLVPRMTTLALDRLRKNASGYQTAPDMDLMDLFIGSEGTLCIFLGARLKLMPLPPMRWSLLMPFDEDAPMLDTVERLKKIPDVIAIEYLDPGSLALLRQTEEGRRVPADFHSLLQIEGTSEASLEAVAGLVADDPRVILADDPRGVALHRALRHTVPEQINAAVAQVKQTYPQIAKVASDMAVPPERLRDLLAMYRQNTAEHNFQYAIFGHIGDAHLHLNILPQNPAQQTAARELLFAWALKVAAWGGTVSAEHGIGRLKRVFYRAVCPPEHYEEQLEVKKVFDPDGLLNPDVLF